MRAASHVFASMLMLYVIGLASSENYAQNYPSKPVRLVVTYSPGGAADILARLITERLSVSFGYPVIIENRAGGGGDIGTSFVAKAPADGYTLLFGLVGPLTVNPSLRDEMPYDTVRDFAPITFVGSTHNLMVVHPSLPVTTVKGFVALAKSRPGELNFASSGLGSGAHLAAILFESMAKINMVHIPYKGNAPAITDLLGGHVLTMFPSILTAAPHVKNGRLRALASTTVERLPAMPDLPTVSETYPGYESSIWYGVLAPAETPAAIVKVLNEHLTKILQMPDLRKRTSERGAKLRSSTPEEFAALIQQDLVKWRKLLRTPVTSKK